MYQRNIAGGGVWYWKENVHLLLAPVLTTPYKQSLQGVSNIISKGYTASASETKSNLSRQEVQHSHKS